MGIKIIIFENGIYNELERNFINPHQVFQVLELNRFKSRVFELKIILKAMLGHA